MTIKLSYDYPPIPIRSFDWSAYHDETYDGPGCPIGHGPTPEEAVTDLIEQLAEACDTDEAEAELRAQVRSAKIERN